MLIQGRKTNSCNYRRVGEATAERIILYRNGHGPCTSVSELEAVKRIGKIKVERMIQYISIE